MKAADPRDQPLVDAEEKRLLDLGWEPADVNRMLSALEEVNPDLPEAVALARMRKIRAKYPEKS